MVVEPESYFDDFVAAGASGLTIHAEVSPHLQRQLARIRELGCAAGVALNPSTSLTAVEDVLAELDLLLVMSVNPGFGGQQFIPHSVGQDRRARGGCSTRRGSRAALEVDGGINRETIGECWRAGADTFVAGNAMFGADDPRGEIGALRAQCARAGLTAWSRPMTARQQWGIVARRRLRARRRARRGDALPRRRALSRLGRLDGAADRGRHARCGQAGAARSPTTRARSCCSTCGRRGASRAASRCRASRSCTASSDRRGSSYVARERGRPGRRGCAFASSRRSSGSPSRSCTTRSSMTTTQLPDDRLSGDVRHRREGTIRKKVIGAADWSSEANRALIRELLGGVNAVRPESGRSATAAAGSSCRSVTAAMLTRPT